MKTEKSSGSDGIPSEYYKESIDIFIPMLTKFFQEAFQSGLLPPSFNEALISLIPNKGRHNTDPTNVRPIGLINVNSKILAINFLQFYHT